MNDITVFGRNPVLEALRSGIPIDEILMAVADHEIEQLAHRRGVQVKRIGRNKLDHLLPGQNHQGIAVRGRGPAAADPDDILAEAARRAEKPLIAVLDGITDPHNLGAIIRSAECAGFHGVIIPEHNSAAVTPVVMKTSAGAAAHLKIATVTNLVQTLEKLKEAGLWIYGTDDQAEKTYTEIDGTDAVAIVIGGEGKGMRRNVAEHCDFHVRIPLYGRVSSLNASVAAGVIFFDIVRKRKLQ